MIKHKFGLMLSVLFFSVMIIMPLSAQVEKETTDDIQAEEKTGDQGGGIMNTLFKALGDATKDSLQEGIDDFIGTYKGRIGEVKLLERHGNSVVLEVKYEGVKRKDGVYVQGEVLNWGEPLDGFSSTLSPLRDKRGSVILTIGLKQQDTSGWGLPSEGMMSDQIRLSLVRETNPERPFGSLVYDFPKTWTSSSDIEIPEEMTTAETAETDDVIELAEGETTEGTQPASPGYKTVKPSVVFPSTGSVLKPAQSAPSQSSTSTGTSIQKPIPGTASPASGSTLTPTISTAQQSAPSTTGTAVKPAQSATSINPVAQGVTQYNFFANAYKAQWKNSSAKLSFPGATNDNRGFVRSLKEGMICPNNKATNLLQTHPQWVNGGIIEGRYPEMILGKNVKFKSVGALLKGANSSDGVIMSVSVLYDGKLYRVLRRRINCNAYTGLEADLSSWAGKMVQIDLNVSSGTTSNQDWAVWVNPRLDDK